MSSIFRCFGLIILLSFPAFPQTAATPIKTASDLLSALVRLPRSQSSEVTLLLKAHADLVTPSIWNQLNGMAAVAYYRETPERALSIYEVAAHVAFQLHDRKLLATTYYNIGRTYSGIGQFTQAIEAYLHSRAAFEKAGLQRDVVYILSDLGSLYFNLEDYSKAKSYSEQSVALADNLKNSNLPRGAWPDEYGVAGAFATLGEVNFREGDHTQAVERLQKSLAIYQQLNRGNSAYNLYIADDYATIGRIFTASGEYNQALLNLSKSLQVATTLGDPTRMASLLNAFGFLYMEQEDYAQAGAYFNRSLQIYSIQNNQKETARVLLNRGVIEQRQGKYDQALTYFRQSLRAAEAAQAKDIIIAADEGIGVALGATGDFKAALDALNKSFLLAEEIKDQTRQTEILWRLAEINCSAGNYPQAVTLSETALPLARAAQLPKLAYLITTTLGQAYAALGRIDLATQTLSQAVEQVEHMRDKVAGQEEEVQLFFENKVSSYHALINLLVKQNKMFDALLLAERAKGRVLLDVLRDGKIDMTKVLTPSEKEELGRLDRRITELNERVRSQQSQTGSNDSHISQLYAQLDAARLKYQSFQDAIYASHPDLNRRRGHASTASLGDTNNLAGDEETAYLEYVCAKEQVYLFALTKKYHIERLELKVYPLSIKPEDLTQKVNKFHQMLADRNPTFADASHDLYNLLLLPAASQLRGIKTLCIVPDGSLWDVPFQALLSADDRYLLEDFSLYYAPSLSVLQEMRAFKRRGQKANPPRASLIAFGNPYLGGESANTTQPNQSDGAPCPLPEAEAEVNALAKLYGRMQSKVFIGREATEQSFKTLAPAYRIIHLAAHGVLDNRHPLYSYLMLTKTDGDPENDGRLEAREIMNMNLHADLAVLSACETGRGRVGAGEGVVGMTWAFLIAGCRTTVVSQWKINSAGTAQLMVNFYQVLKANEARTAKTKADALRTAALSLMKDSRYRHPFYWAGFVMVGSDE